MERNVQDRDFAKMKSLLRGNLRFNYADDCLEALDVLPDWEDIPWGLGELWEMLCMEQKSLGEEGIFYVPMAVRINMEQMKDPEIPAYLEQIRRQYQVPEGILQLEIPETEFQPEQRKVLMELIPNLQGRGIGVVLDKFGSGCLSMNILRAFDFDGIKIDLGYLEGAAGRKKDRVILESIVQMAGALKIPFIADTVTVKEQAEFMLRIGCEHQQGQYFSEELNLKEILAVLRDYQHQDRLHISEAYCCRMDCAPMGTTFNPLLYENMVHYLPGPVVVYQISNQIEVVLANQEADKLSGYGQEEYKELLQKQLTSIVHKEDLEKVKRMIGLAEQEDEALNVTFRIIRKSGEIRWLTMWANIVGRRLGNPVYLAMINDVTKQKKREREWREKAEVDMLTGLYNRGTMEQKIRELLEEQKQQGAQGAMLMIDVDNFKQINDTRGHGAGDRALTAIGEKIRMLFRKSDIYGRMGGDEFVVYMNEINSRESVLIKAEQVSRELHFKIACKRGKPLEVTCSIGIVISPDHGENFEALYEKADQAVYLAKKKGKNQFVLGA